MKKLNITGIILCGGKSQRFGTDKGLAFYKGKPMILHLIEKMTPYCNELFLSTNNPEYQQFGISCIPDENKLNSPLAGILTSLKYASDNWCLIVACDMPEINPDLFNFLFSCSENYEIVVPVHHGFIEPLAGLYSKCILPKLTELTEKNIFKLTDILQHFKTRYCEVSSEKFFHENLFRNINTSDKIFGE